MKVGDVRLFSVQVGGLGRPGVDSLGIPTNLLALLVGPGGAIAALLLFVGYLLKELTSARNDRNSYMTKYENMRESRDEFRFLAGDAVRAGKRAVQTQVATEREQERQAE